MQPIVDLDSLGNIFLYLSAFLGAVFAGLWLSLVIWAFRDIRSRTRDRFIQYLAILLVAVFNLPGLLIYIILRPPETLDDKYQRSLEEEALLSEIETKTTCPGCGSVVQSDWQICPHCHTRLHKPCTNCGRLMELPWQVCPYCGNHTPHPHRNPPESTVEQDSQHVNSTTTDTPA